MLTHLKRRQFLGLAATASTVPLVPHLTGITGDLRATGTSLLKPPRPVRHGPFSDGALRERGAAHATSINARSRASAYRSGTGWTEIASTHWHRLSRRERREEFAAMLSGATHGDEQVEFAAVVSGLDGEPGSPPSPFEAQALGQIFFRSNPTGVDVRAIDASMKDVRQFYLMLPWDTAVALPRNDREFDGDMVLAVHTVSVAAAAGLVEAIAAKVPQGQRRSDENNPVVGGSVTASLAELILGGIQAIAYQEAIGRPAPAHRLAELFARRYLLVGLSGRDHRLVFAQV